jgi:hypothetical protein
MEQFGWSNFRVRTLFEHFIIRLDTAKGIGSLTPHDPSVVAVQAVVKVKGSWVVRIHLGKIP